MEEELQPQEKRTRKVYCKSDVESFYERMKTQRKEMSEKGAFYQKHNFQHEDAANRIEFNILNQIIMDFVTHFDIQP